MAKIVTALFDSEQHASAAATHLERVGIRGDEIDIWSTPHNLAPLLEDDGVSRIDAHAYAEGVRRGCSLVIVKCDGKIERVVSILDQEGALDLDELQASWRSEGWQEAVELVGDLPEALSPGTEEGYDLPGTQKRAGTDAAPDDRSDEAGHGRVRIQPIKAEPPVQK